MLFDIAAAAFVFCCLVCCGLSGLFAGCLWVCSWVGVVAGVVWWVVWCCAVVPPPRVRCAVFASGVRLVVGMPSGSLQKKDGGKVREKRRKREKKRKKTMGSGYAELHVRVRVVGVVCDACWCDACWWCVVRQLSSGVSGCMAFVVCVRRARARAHVGVRRSHQGRLGTSEPALMRPPKPSAEY